MTLILIIGASSVLVLSLVILSLILAGRKKKRLHQALENMLDDVSAKEDARKAWLVKLLVQHFAQQQQAATELCEDFIAAEKQFLHAYMEQQLSKQASNAFYDHLCQLLDAYLKLLPNVALEDLDGEIQQAAETDSEINSNADQADEQQNETVDNLNSTTSSDKTISDVVEDEVEAPELSNDNPQVSEEMEKESANQGENNSSQQDDEQETGDNVAVDLDEKVVDTVKAETANELHPDWDEAFEEAEVEKEESAEKKA